MERIGSLIVFKAGTTPEEAAAMLAKLDGMIEPSITYPHSKPHPRFPEGVADYNKPVTVSHAVLHKFDDDMGGPTCYIP